MVDHERDAGGIPPAAASQAVAGRETDEEGPRSSWLRLGIATILVGAVAAGFAVAFRAGLSAAMHALGGSDVIAMIGGLPIWARIALPATGGLAAGLVGLAIARQRGASGVGYVMEAVVLGRARIPLVRSSLQAIASWVAIAAGNSLGREGPLIQFGAAAGEAARRALELDDTTARVVIASGVAAGFAAAYNAPIAATLFVVEIVTGVLVVETAVPILLATVVATVVTRVAIGAAPIYGAHSFTAPSAVELLAYAGLGVVAAPAGVAFLRLVSLAERGWKHLPLPLRPALGGAVCGAILCVIPEVAGNGFEPLAALLDAKLAIATIAWLALAKPIATSASVGSGNPGGVFTPTLLIGGCVGALYGAGLHAMFGGDAGTSAGYVLVGLAATLAATTHAPMTAAVLAAELTGDYALALPLLVACALAAGLARRLYIDSVYTAELTRRGLRWRLTLDGRRVVENQANAVDVV
jgi:CIC family chloride channel protein